MTFLTLLNYTFIERAYLAGSAIAILTAVLGLFLVLRKFSLIGDGLAHVSFGGIALGLFLGIYPFYVAIPVALISSYFILKLSEKAKLYGDAAIGIVSSLGIASGIILASLSRGFNVDLFSYLFGNILAINEQEVYFSITLSAVVLALIILFYNDLFSITFDSEYAKLTGVRVGWINMLLISLTAITVVLAIKVVGVMLVTALLILPAVTSLKLAKGFKTAIFIAALLAVISVVVGITLSFYADIPAGATIVLVNFALFLLSLLVGKI